MKKARSSQLVLSSSCRYSSKRRLLRCMRRSRQRKRLSPSSRCSSIGSSRSLQTRSKRSASIWRSARSAVSSFGTSCSWHSVLSLIFFSEDILTNWSCVQFMACARFTRATRRFRCCRKMRHTDSRVSSFKISSTHTRKSTSIDYKNLAAGRSIYPSQIVSLGSTSRCRWIQRTRTLKRLILSSSTTMCTLRRWNSTSWRQSHWPWSKAPRLPFLISQTSMRSWHPEVASSSLWSTTLLS